MKEHLNILVSGMIAGDPCQGGAAWAVLQYVLGLQSLGHHVHFVEPIKAKALQPAGSSLAHSENTRYFNQVTRAFGLESKSALLLHDSTETSGLPFAKLVNTAKQTDILINIAGIAVILLVCAPSWAALRCHCDTSAWRDATGSLWRLAQAAMRLRQEREAK